jgi:hypothetical protein
MCAVVVLALSAPMARASFHTVDGVLNFDPSRSAEEASIAGVGGTAYAAWDEPTGILGGLILVKRFDGTRWVPVGGSLNVDATKGASHAVIAGVGGVPYVTWQESDGNKFQIRVARFDGTSWHAVGTSLNVDGAQAGTAPSIASVGGVPYVVWSESVSTPNDFQINVKRLEPNGVTWDQVGTSLNVNTAQPGFEPRIADVAGVPYVTWFEGSSARQVYVKRFNGTSWVSVGGSLNVDATKDATEPRITAIAGVPYVAWDEEDAPAEQVFVKRFDGTNWVAVGPSLNTDPAKGASSPSIAGVGAIPYVLWSDGASGVSTVRVARFDGAKWDLVGGPINSDPHKGGLPQSLAVVGGFPYVAWTEFTNSIAHLFAARQLAPVCAGAKVAVQHDTPVTIPLRCSDAISRAITSGPAHGKLSAINPLTGTVTYKPNRGYVGSDSFSFRGSDGTFDSNLATVALTVAHAPPSARAAISRLHVSPHSFHAASRGPTIAARRTGLTGTKVSYRDTQAAITTFTVLQPRGGIRQGKRCVAAKRGRRGGRCTRHVALGHFTHRDRAGANSFHFTGRLHGKKLPPGAYQLQAVPRVAGRSGRLVRVSFRVIR